MRSKKDVSQRALKARDYYLEVLGWVGASLVLFGYYLNAHKDLSCWPIWAVGNLFVAAYSTYRRAYPTAIMSLLIAIMNIYGYFNWI